MLASCRICLWLLPEVPWLEVSSGQGRGGQAAEPVCGCSGVYRGPSDRCDVRRGAVRIPPTLLGLRLGVVFRALRESAASWMWMPQALGGDRARASAFGRALDRTRLRNGNRTCLGKGRGTMCQVGTVTFASKEGSDPKRARRGAGRVRSALSNSEAVSVYGEVELRGPPWLEGDPGVIVAETPSHVEEAGPVARVPTLGLAGASEPGESERQCVEPTRGDEIGDFVNPRLAADGVEKQRVEPTRSGLGESGKQRVEPTRRVERGDFVHPQFRGRS